MKRCLLLLLFIVKLSVFGARSEEKPKITVNFNVYDKKYERVFNISSFNDSIKILNHIIANQLNRTFGIVEFVETPQQDTLLIQLNSYKGKSGKWESKFVVLLSGNNLLEESEKINWLFESPNEYYSKIISIEHFIAKVSMAVKGKLNYSEVENEVIDFTHEILRNYVITYNARHVRGTIGHYIILPMKADSILKNKNLTFNAINQYRDGGGQVNFENECEVQGSFDNPRGIYDPVYNNCLRFKFMNKGDYYNYLEIDPISPLFTVTFHNYIDKRKR